MENIEKYLDDNIGKDHYAIDFPDEYPKEYVDEYFHLAYKVERVYKEIKYKFSKLYSIKVNYTNSLKTLTGKYSQTPLSFNIEYDGKEYKMVDDWITLTDSDEFFIYEISLSPSNGKLVLRTNDDLKQIKYQLTLNNLSEKFWYIFSEGIIVKDYNTLREEPISMDEMKQINSIFCKMIQGLQYFNGEFEYIFYYGIVNWLDNIKNESNGFKV